MSVETELQDDGLTRTVETPEADTSFGAKADAILREAASPVEEQPETVAPEAPKPAEKWDLKSVAERLQIDPTKLYQDIRVKAGDGELSISELADRYKAQTELDEIKATLTKARGDFEADQVRQARELDEILNVLPREALRPELVQAYQRQKAEYLSREREALLRAIPEWADTGVVTAERKQLTDYLASFGWPEGAIDRVEDHRLFVTLRAGMRDRAELAALKAEAAKAAKPKPKAAVQPKAGQPQTDAQRFGQLKAQVTKGQVSRSDAINRLLKEAGAI